MMVAPAGLEPACSIEREILSLLCLPIPPRSYISCSDYKLSDVNLHMF
jgi:hypothetical protein